MSEPKRRTLYQAHVTTNDGREIPIGPLSDRSGIAESLCEVINKAVADGKEKDWHDARVVQTVALAH